MPLMPLQRLPVPETQFTPLALVRLVPCVDEHVPLEDVGVEEGGGAERALVGLDARVAHQVALQALRMGKGGVALWAPVGFRSWGTGGRDIRRWEGA